MKKNEHSTKQKKKVLVLTSTFPRWKNDSTPPFVFELEKRLAKNFDIFVLSPHFENAKSYEEIEGLKVFRFKYFFPAKYQKLAYGGGILPNIKINKLLTIQVVPFFVSEFITAFKLARSKKITLVHAHWLIPQGLVAYFLYKILKIPYILTSHGSDIFSLNNKLLVSIKKEVLSNASEVTVVSNPMRDYVLKNIDKDINVSVISMGVDSRIFNRKNYRLKLKKKYGITGPFLLFVGRLAEVKGIQYILKALPDIINRFPKTKLLIIGGGGYGDYLKMLTMKLNITNNVIFTGPIPYVDLPEYFATADVFISPSIKTDDGQTEGFGLTLIEAAFSGTVPIGTKVGGITDIIKDKVTGLYVKEKSPNDISKVILNLLDKQTLRKKIINNGRIILVKKYDWEVIKNKFENIFLSV